MKWIYLVIFISTTTTFWYWISKLQRKQKEHAEIIERKVLPEQPDNTDATQQEWEFKHYRTN